MAGPEYAPLNEPPPPEEEDDWLDTPPLEDGGEEWCRSPALLLLEPLEPPRSRAWSCAATGAAMATEKKKPTGAPGKPIQKVACEMRRRMKVKRANMIQQGVQTVLSGRGQALMQGLGKVAPAVRKPAPDAAALLAQIKAGKAAYGVRPS